MVDDANKILESLKNGTEIKQEFNHKYKGTVLGIVSLEKVLESILNVAILDEKDIEKPEQQSVIMEIEESGVKDSKLVEPAISLDIGSFANLSPND